jgi:hypothetical protein
MCHCHIIITIHSLSIALLRIVYIMVHLYVRGFYRFKNINCVAFSTRCNIACLGKSSFEAEALHIKVQGMKYINPLVATLKILWRSFATFHTS